ncbi:MAG TPA: polyribonucleotide nucleotidyltransferase [Candidatus Binatia bacterium]|jgi:polyribonucleotide nucleotidyltransferase|nr:polyribonucleotide nucleotidyltransferase [Candidatus Binatia bacterium]
MAEAKRFQAEWGGKTLTIETGKLANQANAACTVRYGDTVILATATLASKARESVDFFPLSVEYEEKLYAAGKIKSSRFIKREGRPTDEAIMTGRMIDRSIRPLFPYGVRHDVQVVVECLAADLENDTDIPALVGASCALAISDIPWDGPIGGIRVGRVGGEWIINPSFEARANGDVDVVVAGTTEKAVMIEANAKEVPEKDMYEAIMFGQKHLKEVIDLIAQVVAAAGRKKQDARELMAKAEGDEAALQAKEAAIAKAKAYLETRFPEVLFAGANVNKTERRNALSALRAELKDKLEKDGMEEDLRDHAAHAFDDIVEAAVTRAILDKGQRVGGRALNEIRALSAEVALLPRVHGTGLFSRGDTQVLSVVTLGAPADVQVLDGMEEVGKKRYMHHYNFPPYSVGECGRIGGAGRREIGHGGLAERALMPVLPTKEEFPYTIRVVSEVLSSNGSSSQGSICGSTLALMDAGVPIKRPVAGVAMGLASDASSYKILTDLQDLEDGEGGMDFKVGGTRQGITTIQLDTKTAGLTPKIVEETLAQAKEGRMKILDVMEAAIAAPRPELSPYAPRIETIKINPELIRNVIGPGGKMINKIIEETGVSIDVENDGTVTICSANKAGLDKAAQWVRDLTRELKPGELFKEGKVTRIMDFGAFVEVLPGQEGLVHISEMAPWRVGRVTDMVKVGDIVPVKVIEIDELGRVNLSIKRARTDLGIPQEPPAGMGGGNAGGGGFAPRGPRPGQR